MNNFIKKNILYKKINNSPKAKELFKNSIWSIFGALLSKGLLFVSWIIVARILGSEGFGQFGIVRSTVLMFASFAGLGLGITASKHVSEFLEKDKEKTGRILGLTISFGSLMGIIVGLIFYLLSPWLAENTLNAPEITNELKISALILFFSSVNGAQIGALQGFMAFKKIAKINIIQAIVCVPLFILGALYLGVNGTVWAFAISYIVICILSFYGIRKEAKIHTVKIDYFKAWKEKKILFNYSIPAFLGGLMVMPVKWYTEAILVSNSGFSEMGIFTAALTFNNIILLGAGMLSAPFISIMARNKFDDRNSKFNRFNILAPWALGVFFSSPLLVFPEIGSFMFGDSYTGENFDLTFIIIILFTAIVLFKQGLARIMIVYDLQWLSFLSNLVWAIILVFTFYLNSNKGASSLAVSYLIAYIINILLIIPFYYRKKIIPVKTIETKRSGAIWILFFSLAFLNSFVNSIFLKAVILFGILIVITLLFKSLFQNNTTKNNYEV